MSEQFSVNDSTLSKPQGITSGKKQHQSMLISFFFFDIQHELYPPQVKLGFNCNIVRHWSENIQRKQLKLWSASVPLTIFVSMWKFSTFFKRKCTWLDWRLSTNATEWVFQSFLEVYFNGRWTVRSSTKTCWYIKISNKIIHFILIVLPFTCVHVTVTHFCPHFI